MDPLKIVIRHYGIMSHSVIRGVVFRYIQIPLGITGEIHEVPQNHGLTHHFSIFVSVIFHIFQFFPFVHHKIAIYRQLPSPLAPLAPPTQAQSTWALHRTPRRLVNMCAFVRKDLLVCNYKMDQNHVIRSL